MILAIVGPTGVGKTKMSVKLAQKGKGITLKVSNDYAEGKDENIGFHIG